MTVSNFLLTNSVDQLSEPVVAGWGRTGKAGLGLGRRVWAWVPSGAAMSYSWRNTEGGVQSMEGFEGLQHKYSVPPRLLHTHWSN